MSLFEISYNKVTGNWNVISLHSNYKQHVNELEHNKSEYFLILERDNVGIAALDGYKIISDTIISGS